MLRNACFAAWAILNRKTELRVTFSAILRIARGDRYLLIRNFHRPESFAPFGGVYKYAEAAMSELDWLEFRPQSVGPGNDMYLDLRGFIPQKNVGKLARWFGETDKRETDEECITRELQEELAEISILAQVGLPNQVSVRRIRRVEEGPEIVPGQTYSQYRVLDVFSLVSANADAVDFEKRLFEMEARSEDLLVVNAHEIIGGRSRTGALLGHHAAYLFGSRRYRPEIPTFVGDDSNTASAQ